MEDFYRDTDIESESHSERLKLMSGNTNKDIAYFNNLVKLCFQRFHSGLSRDLKINEIKIDTQDRSESFIVNESDVISLYLANYYYFPELTELSPTDRKHEIETHSTKEKVLDEFEKILFNPKGMAIFLGDVGEGKSTFLSKLAMELKSVSRSNEELTYIPIIIDVQRFLSGIENLEDEDAVIKVDEKFWQYVREKIDDLCSHPLKQVADYLRKGINKVIDRDITLGAAIEVNEIEGTVNFEAKKPTDGAHKITKNYEHIRNVSRKMNKKNYRLVLIFDNLDTFYYEHERFVFTPKGFGHMRSKIRIIRKIFEDVQSQFYGENDSFLSTIFTARPYVYEQVFSNGNTASSKPPRHRLFSLCPVSPEKVIGTRLIMLSDLVDHINDSKIVGGKKDALNRHYTTFISFLEQLEKSVGKHGGNVFRKLHLIANQGYRSVIDYYDEFLGYSGNRNFESFFSHNILYMYMLDMMQAYSQVSPEFCDFQKKAHFPNMFLVRADAYCNEDYRDHCYKNDKPIYFLKYLILLILKSGGTKIREIFSDLEDYDPRLLEIALGGLSTINDSNCIQLKFSKTQANNNKSMINTTQAFLTNRGEFLIDEDYCFSFECLQLYWEDFLLMRPRVENLEVEDEYLKRLMNPSVDNMNYNYFLHADEGFYQTSRKQMIREKAERSLVLLNLLEAAKKWESSLFASSWARVKQRNNNIDFFNDDFFICKCKDVIDEAATAMGHGQKQLKKDLEKLQSDLWSIGAYGKFFDKLLAEKREPLPDKS